MKLFNRTTKIAGTLAAALMISAPLALAATPTFASTMHDNDVNKDRHDGDRGAYNRDHGVRHEKIAFHSHKMRHQGRWGYAHGKRAWFAAFNVR